MNQPRSDARVATGFGRANLGRANLGNAGGAMTTRKDAETTLSDAGKQRVAERERRRAEALRANLRRRKAQSRERSSEQLEVPQGEHPPRPAGGLSDGESVDQDGGDRRG